jgi:hypothetical protein
MSKQTVVEGGTTTTLDFDIALGAGAIQGRIFIGGQPASEGQISAEIRGGEDFGQEDIRGAISPEGTYLIEGLAPGEYELVVNLPVPGSTHRRMRNVDATLQEGQTLTLDIDLDDGAHVTGIVSGVVDGGFCNVVAFSGTRQITDSEAIFASPDAQMNGFSKVDAAGAYELSGLQAGDYTIVAYQITNANEGMTFGTGHVTVGDSGTVDLDLALR